MLISFVDLNGGSCRKPAENPKQLIAVHLFRFLLVQGPGSLWIMNDSALNGGSGFIMLKFAVTEAMIPVISSEC